MADRKKDNNQKNQSSSKPVGSTTSLGKRRSLKRQKSAGNKQRSPGANQRNQRSPRGSPGNNNNNNNNRQRSPATSSTTGVETTGSTMSNPKSNEYGSQASPLRVATGLQELNKVAIIGAAGGIGQPLALLLMMHSEYVQHLALYDLVNVPGIATDLSHVDRPCKVTAHLGEAELAEAIRGAKVIVVPAGLAQKPGMSRDDLFGSNAKIMYNIARVCAQVAPDAHLAIISNPVNSLVPLACEVYQRVCQSSSSSLGGSKQQQVATAAAHTQQQQQVATSTKSDGANKHAFDDCFRRIYGVTTLDVVRASTLTAKSHLFKPADNNTAATGGGGLFKDPAKFNIPVVGGHAGKTIVPLLSQCSPVKLDKHRLQEDKTNTFALIESIQQAGIDVLNAKKGTGSATLAMAYAACRFTISLLRAIQGEQNIVECAYVRQRDSPVQDLDYFAAPMLLARDGYNKCLGLGKLLPYEQQMVDEAARELRLSVARGEDFAREQLSAEKS